jgi:hypothetical protein
MALMLGTHGLIKEERSSFLKKRSKRLLRAGVRGPG